MRIKCESCGKMYDTAADELCPECGAYNSFDKGACTHYEGEGKGVGQPAARCGHTGIPEFQPQTYQPQEYVPEEMQRQPAKPAGPKPGWGNNPPQYRAPARADAQGEKKGKAWPIAVALLVLFSIAAPPVAEAVANWWAYGITYASEAMVLPCSPQNAMEVGGEFILQDWQAQRVYENDGTSYIYVTVQLHSVGESSSYHRVDPYMEAADDFWAPASDAQLQWELEAMGFVPDDWELYLASKNPKTVGWIFPDFGDPVVYISIADIEKGSDHLLRSRGKVYQVELTVTETEGGDYYGGI